MNVAAPPPSPKKNLLLMLYTSELLPFFFSSYILNTFFGNKIVDFNFFFVFFLFSRLIPMRAANNDTDIQYSADTAWARVFFLFKFSYYISIYSNFEAFDVFCKKFFRFFLLYRRAFWQEEKKQAQSLMWFVEKWIFNLCFSWHIHLWWY